MNTPTTPTTPITSYTSPSTPAQEMAQLERLLRRVEDRWRSLVIAEQRGQSRRTLERMYAAYLDAVEEYVHVQRTTAYLPKAS